MAIVLATAVATVGVVPAVAGDGEFSDTLHELDLLHLQDRHDEVHAGVDRALGRGGALGSGGLSEREQAELYMRRARAIVAEVELSYYSDEMPGDEARRLLSEAEEHAERAIELNPELADSYFWKGAAMGTRGVIRGVLRALFMAGSIRDLGEAALERNPDHTESHFLLAQLYDELPGRPLSFGNDARAVSLARRAHDLHEAERLDWEIEMRYDSVEVGVAERLWSRNWSERRRERRHDGIREDYADATDALERSYTYEGSLELKPISDRDEARQILSNVIERLEAVEAAGELSRRQRTDLEAAREHAEDWGM